MEGAVARRRRDAHPARVRGGIPSAEVRDVLAGDAYGRGQGDIDEAHALGIGGVPFFVIDRRYGISGAQPSELFVSALQQASAEAATAR